MVMIQDLSKAQMALQVMGDQVDRFSVIRYRGEEGLCQLYRFEIDLASSSERVSFDAIVGKPAVLSINTLRGPRWFHGVVSRFELTGETHDQMYYRAQLVPSLWRLSHRYNSRIFQNKTVPDIITEVLNRAGLASDRFRLVLQRSYEPREYCVQYRETDYNFICRLLEEEGIWWYFEQTQEAHTLVMADSPAAYAPVEGDPRLPYVPPTGMNVEEDHIFRFRMGQSVRPGAVVLNDFDFEKPRLNLQTRMDAGRDLDLEFSDYPGEYLQQSQGSAIAKIRCEEFESGRFLGVGQSHCHRLAPGRTFQLAEHPADSLNQTYLVTSICHEGKESVSSTFTSSNGRRSLLDGRVHESVLAARQSENPAVRELAEALLQIASRLSRGDGTAHRALTQWLYHAGQVSRDLASIACASGANALDALAIPNLIDDVSIRALVDGEAPVYTCRFQCIPASVSYRPPRVTPWPVMRGSQTARVVGPASEEIYCDKYGRVKVQFNWDREGKFDERSSCWIRVSQGMAGGQYGITFLPRVGQEVIVDFLEGDPDKPIITGRVFNADHMPPYKLPDEKTKSCIKTHSSRGGGGTNEIRFEDLKGREQLFIHAEKDLHIRTRNDRVENVDHDHHLTVKENKIELVKKAKSSEVMLDQCEKIGGKKSLEVKGDVGEDFKGSHSEKVGNTFYLKSGMNVVIEAGAKLTLKVGGNFIAIDPSGVTIVGTLVRINSGGAAGSGSPVALKAPVKPLEADQAKPGKDTTYSGGKEPGEHALEADVAGITFPPDEIEQKERSWIELELVDDEGIPVPYEQYRITTPDGKVQQGSLNEQGLAHIEGIDPGNCEIIFPNLDREMWRR